jgi:hypothetical protein
MRTWILMILILAAGFSCSKELTTRNCRDLKKALAADDVHALSSALRKELGMHSKESLEKLAAAISLQCDVKAAMLCFGCIYTLPAQSEMKVEFIYNGVNIKKVIDLIADSNNQIEIKNIHN